MSVLPQSSNSAIKKVLIDLLLSTLLSVPTSSLHGTSVVRHLCCHHQSVSDKLHAHDAKHKGLSTYTRLGTCQCCEDQFHIYPLNSAPLSWLQKPRSPDHCKSPYASAATQGHILGCLPKHVANDRGVSGKHSSTSLCCNTRHLPDQDPECICQPLHHHRLPALPDQPVMTHSALETLVANPGTGVHEIDSHTDLGSRLQQPKCQCWVGTAYPTSAEAACQLSSQSHKVFDQSCPSSIIETPKRSGGCFRQLHSGLRVDCWSCRARVRLVSASSECDFISVCRPQFNRCLHSSAALGTLMTSEHCTGRSDLYYWGRKMTSARLLYPARRLVFNMSLTETKSAYVVGVSPGHLGSDHGQQDRLTIVR